MSAGNEAWIQDSLARLEQLEAHRERIAAVGRTDELAEIDEEIKSLYEVLEAAAEQDGDQPANQPPAASPSAWGDVPHPAFGPTPGSFAPAPAPFHPAPVAAPAPAPFHPAPVAAPAPAPFHPAPVAAPAPAPFEESPFAAPSPQPFAPAAPAPSFEPSYDAGGLDDEPKRGNGALMGIAIVAVLGLGGGGYWMFGRPKPVEPPPAAPTGEVQVFKAGEIPEDTQEPQVAKGGDASRTPTVTLGGSDGDDRKRSSSSSRPSSSGNRPVAEPEKPTGRSIKVEATDDPLAGAK